MLTRKLSSALAVLVTACALAGCQKTAEGRLEEVQEQMIGQIKVEGFQRVHIGTFDKAGQGIYVGAPVSDVQSHISGGGVSLGPAQSSSGWVDREALYQGKGTAPDGTECFIVVDRLRPGQRPDDTWGLSKIQANDVADGKQQLLFIGAACGGG